MIAGGGLAATLLGPLTGIGQVAATRSVRCADFLSSIGVNTHVRYQATRYGDVKAVEAAARYVGFRFARDAAPDAHAPDNGHYSTLAAAGLSFCFLWGPRRVIRDAVDDIDALEAAHPGAVHAIEGPNEIKPNYAYGGLTGLEAGQKYMTDIRAAMASSRHLADKPLVNFTAFKATAGDCDFANHHPYPKAGKQPRELLSTIADRLVGPSGAMPGKPLMFTEFGYHTLVGRPARPGAWQGVDEESQAALLVNGWLDCARLGVARVYLYELFDERPDNAGAPSQENHFGLFRHDGSPKPAATAFRTLFTALADTHPRARTFTPDRPAAELTLPQGVACLSLQAASGRRFFVLWNESPIWDADALRAQRGPSANVRIAFAAPMAVTVTDVLDPGGSRSLAQGRLADVQVGSHPLILTLT
jgi:hypothetical protein